MYSLSFSLSLICFMILFSDLFEYQIMVTMSNTQLVHHHKTLFSVNLNPFFTSSYFWFSCELWLGTYDFKCSRTEVLKMWFTHIITCFSISIKTVMIITIEFRSPVLLGFRTSMQSSFGIRLQSGMKLNIF